MPTRIYICGNQGLWPGCSSPGNRSEDAVWKLARDLKRDLPGWGEVIDEDEHSGPGWSIELLVHEHGDIEPWIQGLPTFLRRWGVPDGPIQISIYDDQGAVVNFRRITA